MKILALETSAKAVSAAVTEDGRGVSPSVCRAFLAEDAAADEEEG